MVNILYINTLPVSTVKFNKEVYVDVVLLWKTLRVRENVAPLPLYSNIITSESDKAFTLGHYSLVPDVMAALRAMPDNGLDYPDQRDLFIEALEEVLLRFWSSLPEFTPLKH